MSAIRIKASTSNKKRTGPDYATGYVSAVIDPPYILNSPKLTGIPIIDQPLEQAWTNAEINAEGQTPGRLANKVTANGGNAVLPSPNYKDSSANKAALNLWGNALSGLTQNQATVLFPIITEIYTILAYANEFGFDLSPYSQTVFTPKVNTLNLPAGSLTKVKFMIWLQSNFPTVYAQALADLNDIGQQALSNFENWRQQQINKANAAALSVLSKIVGGLGSPSASTPTQQQSSQPIQSQVNNSSILIYLAIAIILIILIARQ